MEQSADYWRGAGERIETLLQANVGAGPVARDRAEQLVREVVQLYGAALERTVALADPATMDADRKPNTRKANPRTLVVTFSKSRLCGL